MSCCCHRLASVDVVLMISPFVGCLQGEDTDHLCGAIAAIAEVFKLTDPALLFLEVTTLGTKYPDIRYKAAKI